MGTTRTTLAAVSRDADKPFGIEELTIGDLRDNELVVDMVATGICHTDLSSHHGMLGTAMPAVLGHEGAGRVLEVGPAITQVAPGDPVVLTANACGTCPSCITGLRPYCHQMYPLNAAASRLDGSSAFIGSDVHSHFFGQSSFSSMAVATEANVVKVGYDVDLEIAGPLGCGIMTGAGAVLRALEVGAGSSIAVFGCGAVGLSAVMAARCAGASDIVAVDVVDSRLQLARELGATHIVNAADGDPAPEVTEVTSGGAQYTIEAAGHPATLRAAVDSLGIKGQCALLGQAGFGVEGTFDWLPTVMKGATIRGVSVGDAIAPVFIPELLRLHAAGEFPYERLISPFPFAEINDAVVAMESGAAVKPVLVF